MPFKKGMKKLAGRKKGVRNKIPAKLQDAILEAASLAGGGGPDGTVNYLKARAIDTPGPFMALMGKVLPLTLQGNKNSPIEHKHGLYLTDEQLHNIAAGGGAGAAEKE